MRKESLIILFVLGFIFNSIIAEAQSGRFSLAFELGIPMGDLGDTTNFGWGTSLRYEHPIGDKMGLTFTAGYIVFSGKSYTFDDGNGNSISLAGPSYSMIPLQAGFKYYFSEQQKGFYGMVELGVHITTVEELIVLGKTYPSNSSTDFSYAPEVGYHLEHFDFGLRYQMISSSQDVIDPVTFETKSESVTNSYIGLRAAYVFGSSK